jgi:hypothetical protein
MTAPRLRLMSTLKPGYNWTIGQIQTAGVPVYIESDGMRASDLADAINGIGGDEAVAALLARAPDLLVERDEAIRERDEARALLIEEQQARHAAGTRVVQLEQSLTLLVNNTSPPPVARFDTDEEYDAAIKGRADTADWYRTRIKLALAAVAALPPSPAGASAPASGSTPAASSVTSSSSEAAGNPSAPHGTREGGAA